MSITLQSLMAKTVAMVYSEHIVDPEWPETTMCGKRIPQKPRCKVCMAAVRKRLSKAND